MGAHAVIDDAVTDSDHETADDGWISAHGGLNICTELLAQ